MAAERGVKVYTVGIGTKAGETIGFEGWSMRVKLDEAWARALREAEAARIEEGLAVLRRGGVVCPEVADRFLEADPSRATLHLTATAAVTAQVRLLQPMQRLRRDAPEIGLARDFVIFDDDDHGKFVLGGKKKIALVMRRDRHDGACTVIH